MATVAVAPTADGQVWFKAAGAGTAFEAPLYDWGDAVLAHPFAAMLVPVGYVQHHHGDAALARARDAYLAGFGDPAELRETLELACRVANIARTLTWERALRAALATLPAADYLA